MPHYRGLQNARIVTNIEETDCPDLRLPERLYDDVSKLRSAVIKQKPWVVEKLKDWIRHFPKQALFKNLLYNVYFLRGNKSAAHKVAEIMYREHPDYLYSRTNLAESLLDLPLERLRVPEILHPSLSLEALYPHRKAFHTAEVVQYERAAIFYLACTGKPDDAAQRLEYLVESGLAGSSDLSYLNDYIDKYRPYDPELPALQIPNLEVLYFAGQNMTPALAREIMAQPRETLVADLCRILDDLVDNADHWLALELPGYAYNTPMHAMILLAELGAEEALPTILRFLRQDKEDVDFWMGDLVTELLPDVVSRFASPAQYELLAGFATDRDIDEFIADAAILGVVRRAWLQPELKPAATGWLSGVIETLMPDEKPGQSNGHLDMAVSAIIDLQAESLLPLAEKCFQLDLLDLSFAGPYPGFEAFFYEESHYHPQNYPDLEGVYRFLGTGWLSDDAEPLPPSRPDNDWVSQIRAVWLARQGARIAEAETRPAEPMQAPAGAKGKVSLNDPCPCGSGKKYKRCCGKG